MGMLSPAKQVKQMAIYTKFQCISLSLKSITPEKSINFIVIQWFNVAHQGGGGGVKDSPKDVTYLAKA